MHICRKRTSSSGHFALLLLCLLLVITSCKEKAPPKEVPKETSLEKTKGIKLEETRLATISEDYDRWGNISFSADGHLVLYTARKRDKEFLVAVSADSEDISPAYESVSWLVRSPDGRRFAFGGKKGEKKHLVIDNKELKEPYYEEVAPGSFSPDGRLVACEVGGLKEKKWFIFVSDGEKEVYRSKVYPDTYRAPSFSPDGRLLVYELGDDKREAGNKKRTVFFLDLSAGKIIKERRYTEGEESGRFAFSADSSRVIYEVGKEGKISLVLHDFSLNEEREMELPYASIGRLALSPDGKKIVYIATKEGKHYLVESLWESPAQGKERGPYEGIGPAVFSPDSLTVAFLAMEKGKWQSVVGDKEGAAVYDGVGNAPVFSPDGTMIAYPAMKKGKWVMVISPVGNPSLVKEGSAYDMVVTPVWSPDGKYITYRARTGTMEEAKRFIVIADAKTGKVIKEGPVCDEVWPPVFSPDGKSVAYGVRIGSELWWKVEPVP
ncbi:MAG: WD40 repeat domain-containing protein [Nitrospirae bacterium]|nr:WD40 repeat domain-containing protein [Nitrospirota bacterium]